MRLLLRWIINAAALLLCANLIAGFEISSFYAALIAALVLGLLNAIIRPILVLLTLPVTMVTLGLFVFVINALLIWFMSTFVKGVTVEGFLPALMVALILWAVGVITNWFLRETEAEK